MNNFSIIFSFKTYCVALYKVVPFNHSKSLSFQNNGVLNLEGNNAIHGRNGDSLCRNFSTTRCKITATLSSIISCSNNSFNTGPCVAQHAWIIVGAVRVAPRGKEAMGTSPLLKPKRALNFPKRPRVVRYRV